MAESILSYRHKMDSHGFFSLFTTTWDADSF